MQITVEIPDELVAKVQARGLTPESYVRGLIDGAERSDPKPLRLREPRMSMKEFLEAMAANSDKMPVLPAELLDTDPSRLTLDNLKSLLADAEATVLSKLAAAGG